MEKIRIIADSACDLPLDYSPNVRIIPLKVNFGEEMFLDGVNLSHEDFYKKLAEGGELPKSSQATIYELEEIYKEELQNYDKLIVITISSKCSGTYNNACVAAQEFPDKVAVIDTYTVSVGQTVIVQYADRLVNEGKMNFEEMVKELHNAVDNLECLAIVSTLKYLWKGGRLSMSAALFGSLLAVKPVVATIDGKCTVVGKARGSKHAKLLMTEMALEKGVDLTKPVVVGYTGLDKELMDKYIVEHPEVFDGHENEIYKSSIGCAIGVHIGPDAIGLAFIAKNKVKEENADKPKRWWKRKEEE